MATTGTASGSGVASTAPGRVDRAAPTVGWATGPLGDVQLADREIGRQTAARARAVAAFAATRPASVDRQPGEPGCASAATRAARPEVMADVSEWAAQELAVALSITEQAARTQLANSLTLVHRLPRVLAALESGFVHTGHLWAFQERVAAIGDPALRAEVEGELLAWMSGRVTTPAQLADKARRLVLARDPRGAAERLARALQERGVFSSPRREDGMSALTAVLATAEARACLDVLGRLADAIVDDEPTDGGPPVRTRAQKMADCLMDLVLRPGETDLPVIQAQLTLVATVETMAGGDQPGELDGEPVPAEVVRALARKFGLVPDLEPQPTPAPAAHPAPAAPIAATARADRPGVDEQERRQGGDETARPAEEPDGDDQWVRRGADSLPEDLERAHWEREAAWEQWLLDTGFYDPPDLGDENRPEPPDHSRDLDLDLDLDLDQPDEPPGWPLADAAVQQASAALEAARQAIRDATGAVTGAERSAAVDEDTWSRSAAGLIGRARSTLAALGDATLDQRSIIGELLDRTAGGGLVDRPRLAVVDALDGTLLALTDAPGLLRSAHCGRPACHRREAACTHDLAGVAGLGAPPETAGYRPSPRLDRFLRLRDRRCRFPGCRKRVRVGELDHDRPYPQGPTAADNLAGYCVHHHRGKHQAPGWTYLLHPDGRLTVSTPTGLTTTTSPPPLGVDPPPF